MSLKLKVLIFAVSLIFIYTITQQENEPVVIAETQNSPAQSDSVEPITTTEPVVSFDSIPSILREPADILNTKDTFSSYEARALPELPPPDENWNLASYGLPADMVLPFFSKNQASEIVFFANDGTHVILPEHKNDESTYQGSLYISTTENVEKTRQERIIQAEKADQKSNGTTSENSDDSAADNNSRGNSGKPLLPEEDLVALPKNAFEVVSFTPGTRDNNDVFAPHSNNYIGALQGPDFPFKDDQSPEAMQRRLSTVLTLGHGGSVLLKVAGDGFLLNKSGFDFVIFENAFRIGKTNLIYQEFAKVGVSDKSELDSFKWFSCNPRQKIIIGCAGAVPTSEGGDQFDLSVVGVDKIKYILIVDVPKNQNFPSKWPTEGVDLDAVRLHNAYKNK